MSWSGGKVGANAHMSDRERATLRGSTVLIKPKPNVKPKVKPKKPKKVTRARMRAVGNLPVPDEPSKIVRVQGTGGVSATAGKGGGKKKKKKLIPAARRGRGTRGTRRVRGATSNS